MKQRLDVAVSQRGLAPTRSQAESYIRLGSVTINKCVVTKPATLVDDNDQISLTAVEQYVSRAGLKLASVARALNLDFRDMVVLDVGSSTGGFTDYALQHGARKVIAVDVGTDQLHPRLLGNPRIESHEKTDIRSFNTDQAVDIILIDVSFISLRLILPQVARLASSKTIIAAMVKPQFETVVDNLKHNGIIKNDRIRRDILQHFESWARPRFIILDKIDSAVPGAKGNLERFYTLQIARQNSNK